MGGGGGERRGFTTVKNHTWKIEFYRIPSETAEMNNSYLQMMNSGVLCP